MSQLKSCVADVMDRIRRRHDADPGEFWHACLFWTFWVSLALFPIGYGWREVTPPLCFIFLLLYYRHAWHRSVLRRLTVWPLFLCAGAMTLIGVVFSTDVWQSFLHGGMGVNKAYILPFIAMECVRSTRDLRRLVHACVLACVWQGLDGMWQAWTGFDFIMGYAPNAGRLTGSLGDYSVGNYMALAMIPAFACWFLLRRRLGVLPAAVVWVVLFIPAFFLLEGASSRSGILAVASAFVFWALLAGGRTGRIALWGCVLVLGGFTLLSFHRMDPSTIAGDGRWSLWSLGWQVFLEHPWLGAGLDRYNACFRALGLVPAHDAITISHPHNMYLDILYAHGIIGFILGMIFLLGFAWWAGRHIRRALHDGGVAQRAAEAAGSLLHWRLTAWFYLGYLGWLVNGIFGHDFYRIWWLGLAMCSLGICIGGVVSGLAADGESIPGGGEERWAFACRWQGTATSSPCWPSMRPMCGTRPSPSNTRCPRLRSSARVCIMCCRNIPGWSAGRRGRCWAMPMPTGTWNGRPTAGTWSAPSMCLVPPVGAAWGVPCTGPCWNC